MKMMKRFVLVFISAVFFLACFVGFVQAEDGPAIPDVKEKTFSVGLNFPGLQFRQWINRKVALELRGQFEEGILAAGLRAYYKLETFGFWGIEIDHLACYDNGIDSTCFAAGFFIGEEFFFLQKQFSLICDLGLYHNILSARGKSVSGLDVVANFGINWYIW